MTHRSSSRSLGWLGIALTLMGMQVRALAQAPNPLGVEWAGGGGTATKPATKPAPAPAGANPLGVEWAGSGKKPSGSTPAPATTNPLAVEWAGGHKAAEPAPAPATGNPLGVQWVGGSSGAPRPIVPAPQQPAPQRPAPLPVPPQGPAPVGPTPESPPPQAGSSETRIAAALVDDWSYQAVAFSDAGGTVSETRGVNGTLKLKADGQYEQALYIGGILNAMKGSYRVVAGRLETTYTWRGRPATDVFELHLDGTGKRLTLSGLGSPRARYTLQRLD